MQAAISFVSGHAAEYKQSIVLWLLATRLERLSRSPYRVQIVCRCKWVGETSGREKSSHSLYARIAGAANTRSKTSSV